MCVKLNTFLTVKFKVYYVTQNVKAM